MVQTEPQTGIQWPIQLKLVFIIQFLGNNAFISWSPVTIPDCAKETWEVQKLNINNMLGLKTHLLFKYILYKN